MNWNLFWTAFSAIGTTMGTFVTAIAAILAYRQYSLSKSAKLKIIAEFSIKMDSLENPEEYFVLKFVNKGIIDLYVNEISIAMNDEYFCIDNFFKKSDNVSGKLTFPIRVTKEQIVSIRMLRQTLRFQVDILKRNTSKNEDTSKRKNILKRKNDTGNIEYLRLVITDGQGKRHVKRIKYDFINHQ